MSGKTKIEWTATYNPDGTVTPGKVWNPVTGCRKVSEGCRNCYAKTLHDMRHKAYEAGAKLPAQYEMPFEIVQMHPERLSDPLRWKQPARVFVNSMSDLFHEDVPDGFITDVLWAIKRAPQHTFMVLTKRPERMWECMGALQRINQFRGSQYWPIDNLWLGVSVENQAAADERIPYLLQTPAAVRFVSCEPLLEPVSLSHWMVDRRCLKCGDECADNQYTCEICGSTRIEDVRKIGWVIVGGESGTNARPMHPDWARSLRDQCQSAGVPFFYKQAGEWTTEYPQGRSLAHMEQTYQHGAGFYRVGKAAAGRLLDGREWNQFPLFSVDVLLASDDEE